MKTICYEYKLYIYYGLGSVFIHKFRCRLYLDENREFEVMLRAEISSLAKKENAQGFVIVMYVCSPII